MHLLLECRYIIICLANSMLPNGIPSTRIYKPDQTRKMSIKVIQILQFNIVYTDPDGHQRVKKYWSRMCNSQPPNRPFSPCDSSLIYFVQKYSHPSLRRYLRIIPYHILLYYIPLYIWSACVVPAFWFYVVCFVSSGLRRIVSRHSCGLERNII